MKKQKKNYVQASKLRAEKYFRQCQIADLDDLEPFAKLIDKLAAKALAHFIKDGQLWFCLSDDKLSAIFSLAPDQDIPFEIPEPNYEIPFEDLLDVTTWGGFSDETEHLAIELGKELLATYRSWQERYRKEWR
jgi:hypothetical protein